MTYLAYKRTVEATNTVQMRGKPIRFRTGFFKFPDTEEEAKILFDEDGNIYDKSIEGVYRNCVIRIDNIFYPNSTLSIIVKKTLIQAKYELSASAIREDGKKLELVKLRDSGYARWWVTFPPGHEPSPTQRPRS